MTLMEAEGDPVSKQEAFEYTYRLFINAVEALSSEPAHQVLLNGNYNTAFELLHEARAGKDLLLNSASYLSEEQCLAISDFIETLDVLSFRSHSGRELGANERLESNLADMLHPSWVPVRASAMALQAKLAGATALNKGYFDSLWL
jgi:hypothetical protein